MHATDSFKSLRRQTGLTIAQIRETARDLGLEVSYSAARRTWYLAEDASTVRAFNDHITR